MNLQTHKEDNQDKESRFDFLDFVIVGWGFIILTFASAAALSSLFGPERYLMIVLLQLVFVTVYLRFRKLRITENLRWFSIPRRTWLPSLLVALGVAVLLDEVDRLAFLLIPPPEEYFTFLKASYTSNSTLGSFLIIFAVGILGAFSEESVFRGFIQRYFEKRMNVTSAVLWTSLFFMIIHLQPWIYIQLLIMSVLCGYLAWRWNSVLPAFLVHSMSNLLNLVLIGGYFPVLEQRYLWGGHVNPIILSVGLLLFLAGLRSLEKTKSDSTRT